MEFIHQGTIYNSYSFALSGPYKEFFSLDFTDLPPPTAAMFENLSLHAHALEKAWKSLLSKAIQITSDKLWAVAGFFLLVISSRKIIQRLQRRSIRYLRGPPASSWLVGNLPQAISPSDAGEFDFRWVKEYGTAFKIKGFLSIDMLFLTDPKTIHYVLNATGYTYKKSQQQRASTRLMVGEGLVFADGEQHARQRKLMNPAFSSKVISSFFEIFQLHTHKMIDAWKQIIYQSGGNTCVIDVPSWVSRTLLDIIGQAGFNYDFGALGETKSPLTVAYRDLFLSTTYKRSASMLIFEAIWGYLPFWMVRLVQRLPTKKLKRVHWYKRVAGKVAKDMIKLQTEQYLKGDEGGKDVLSILIRANLSEDPLVRISDHEVEGQLTTLMLAGHDTTASSVMWGLYELSRRPECQHRIREEITQLRLRMSERGNDKLTMADLESMRYFNAFIKELHRFHPVIRLFAREASREDVLPLSEPVQIENGTFINALPISKGQMIIINASAYNRLTSVWGDDADTFRPERFLEESKEREKIGVGVTSNLLTFSSGIRGCIGWRFATTEIQIIFMELLQNFSFAPDPDQTEIVRAAASIVTPMTKNNPGRASLPLTVSAL